jgi:hypothetical protein
VTLSLIKHNTSRPDPTLVADVLGERPDPEQTHKHFFFAFTACFHTLEDALAAPSMPMRFVTAGNAHTSQNARRLSKSVGVIFSPPNRVKSIRSNTSLTVISPRPITGRG